MAKIKIKLLQIIMVLIITILSTGASIVAFNYLRGMSFSSFADLPMLGQISFSSFADLPMLGQGEDFNMPDITGQRHNGSEWLGYVVLLNFWATWCPPCRQEIPGFIDLYHTYHEQGLVVVGVAIDEIEQVRRFVTDLHIDYPNLLGEDLGIKLAVSYGNRTGGLPYTVIIDRTGKVVSTHLGALSSTDAEKAIQPLL